MTRRNFWRRLWKWLLQPSPWMDTMNEHDYPDEQDGYSTDAAGTYDGR